MGSRGILVSKRYSSLKSFTNSLKLFPDVLLNGPHTRIHFILEIFKNWNFNNFFFCSFRSTWDPMGAKMSKCYSYYKLQQKIFKNFS